ncbi:uncharacterized protein L203_100471 [Cryptococcus depauperatus CBS 7841]|uniref:Uncharacterized protein n=1 Tax=Cryptococcus depauperatus CBS 7841 TaxID=1295531 RepID=A0A1E3HLX0_9TREE|nr:hypothetical protein L203_06278 [Cryptococcus depauperatus CBS 7841]
MSKDLYKTEPEMAPPLSISSYNQETDPSQAPPAVSTDTSTVISLSSTAATHTYPTRGSRAESLVKGNENHTSRQASCAHAKLFPSVPKKQKALDLAATISSIRVKRARKSSDMLFTTSSSSRLKEQRTLHANNQSSAQTLPQCARKRVTSTRTGTGVTRSNTFPGKGKGKAESFVDPTHLRPARERVKCPNAIQDRCVRAVSQRMFMIQRISCQTDPVKIDQFKVLGSTGNVYTVTMGPKPDCDCPDCTKGNLPCKHIIFVFLKILKIPRSSALWYQKGLTPVELQRIFSNAPAAPPGSIAVNASVHRAYLKATGALSEDALEAESGSIQAGSSGSQRKFAIGEDCPVCYEEMTQADEDKKNLVYDESLGGCGRPLHTQCFKMWALSARNFNKNVTCVWCRSPWADNSSSRKRNKSGPQYSSLGYLNMAQEAGMSRERDVSTYYHGGRYRYLDSCQ